MPRLNRADVACWVLKSAVPPAELAPGWRPGTPLRLARCLRPSYRVALMAPEQRCLLWVSDATRPGVHALGTLDGPVRVGDGGQLEVPVRLTLLAEPIPRAELLADPAVRSAEVLRMPAGSNPSWLSHTEYAALLGRF